jgi:hypothetical protein
MPMKNTGMGINVHDDYRTLLVDGVVGHEWHDFPFSTDAVEDEIRRWAYALVRLANADGLRAGLMWCHADDVAYDPGVELLSRDGSYLGGPNIFPYDQASSAEWHRPRAVAEWGERLEAARRRAGI